MAKRKSISNWPRVIQESRGSHRTPCSADVESKIESLASPSQNRTSAQARDWERGDNAQQRLVQADGRRTAELSPQTSRQLDYMPAPLKNELALWRAFLGDEIDAILRDKD